MKISTKTSIVLPIAVLIALVLVVGFYVQNNQTAVEDGGYYTSQAECEKATGKKCEYSVCDYIPEGKTRKEVCGDHPGEAWVVNI